MATWARRETAWTTPLALWLSEAGDPWLVPTGIDVALSFRLVNALHHASSVPWAFAGEREAGLGRAAAWLKTVAQAVTR